MLEDLSKEFGYPDFVAVIFALVDGKHFDTGRRRFAEYVRLYAEQSGHSDWRYLLSRELLTVLDHISARLLLIPRSASETTYGRDEFLVLCLEAKSPDIARALNAIRLTSIEEGTEKAFERVLGETFVNIVTATISSPYSVDIALVLCRDPAYARYGAMIYFSLLHQAQGQSYAALPALFGRYKYVVREIEGEFHRKHLELAFKAIDLNFYLNRMPQSYLSEFLRIIHRTELSQAYNSVNADAEIGEDIDVPKSYGSFQTTKEASIEPLAPATSQVWMEVREEYVARNPVATRETLRQLQEALANE